MSASQESQTRRLARRLVLGVAGVGPARRAALHMLSLRQSALEGSFGFTDAEPPTKVEGFEDLAFLFSSNLLNYRVAGLRFIEAAFLYKLARSLPDNATVAEIGRFQGGSTFVLAAALHGGELYSYDLPTRGQFSGGELDDSLRAALSRAGFAEKVKLVVADSRTADPPPNPCDLVFVDGDHSYEGVRADYEHWREFVRPGGHVVFHDAVSIPDLVPSALEGVAQLVREIEARDGSYFVRRAGAGTLAHFVRTETPAPWDERAVEPTVA